MLARTRRGSSESPVTVNSHSAVLLPWLMATVAQLRQSSRLSDVRVDKRERKGFVRYDGTWRLVKNDAVAG